MNIAVVGGTGALGRRTVRDLRLRGHNVRALSRRSLEYPVDLTTGEGLAHALKGCDVIVDASNDLSRRAEKTFVQGSRRLLAAEEVAGVHHHVCISIVGIDKVPVGYYGIKLAQERAVEEGSIPWTIVRSTQFQEFCERLIATGARWPMIPVPRALVQPVAIADASHAIAEICERSPRLSCVNVAGPEICSCRDLAMQWKTAMNRRAFVLEIPLPGKLGRALREGALTIQKPDVYGGITFKDWLQSDQEKAELSHR
jgi:uncharacterized protein YbjT (DUF2867 family)